MGAFEDLIARAREGETEALDELEQSFSGSSLRQIAEENKAWREKNLPLVRKAKFDDLVGQLDDDLKAAGLTADQFGNVDPDELTLDVVKARATETLNQRRQAKLAAAKDAGFETVEEYEAALQSVKQANEQRRQTLEAAGKGAASGGGAGDAEPSDNYEAGMKDFNRARELGATTDEAMGEAVHTILARQAPVPIEE